jgi:SAM-dependent methyltransferase
VTEELYHNRFAHLYDYFQKGVEGDVQFYLDYFQGFRGKNLEMGAGTGRITLPLARNGLQVVALDISPAMLKILLEKARQEGLKVEAICADMKRFKLKERFAAILITYRTFQHAYTVEDQFAVLNNVKNHLERDGVFIFDVYNPKWQYIARGDWRWHFDEWIKLPGVEGRVRMDYRNRYDMAKQMMYQEFRLRYKDGKELILPLKMRFFFRFEMEHLLRLAGFKVEKLYGDFKKSPFDNSSSEMVWVVRLA